MRDVLEKFLATHKNFIIDHVSFEGLPQAVEGMITTYPPRDQMDGFFMAHVKRIS